MCPEQVALLHRPSAAFTPVQQLSMLTVELVICAAEPNCSVTVFIDFTKCIQIIADTAKGLTGLLVCWCV